MSRPVSRAPSAMTLASLCSRASFADKGSDTSAQRQAGLRLTAIEMPTPDPHSATPRCALPFATQIGRESCPERESQYVYITVGAARLTKNTTNHKQPSQTYHYTQA